MLIAASAAQAAHDEEKFLSLQPAEVDAKAKDYDDYFRVIHWPNRLPSTVIRIYLSHNPKNPSPKGYISITVRFPTGKLEDPGKFFERSRALTEKEGQGIYELIESEEIFSLPPTQLSYGISPQYGSEKGPGHYFFVHVDKLHHRKEEVARRVLASHPAQRVVAGVVEVVKDFLPQIEKESGWADFRMGKEK